MTRFALCTSVYEAGRPFLAAWIDAALTAARGHDCRAVVAVDDLGAPEEALARLARAMPVSLAPAPAGAAVARVRAAMLRSAAESEVDVLVFCDMDDMLAPEALPSHARALEAADFSYGDMELVDGAGRGSGRSFLGDAAVPDRLDSAEALAERNWLGFSNTALVRARLPASALAIPDSVLAADWWFFTELLAQGLAGARTEAVVARYRCHAGNTLGPGPACDTAALRRRLDIMGRHYAARAGDAGAEDRAAAVRALIDRLERDPGAVPATARGANGVWYEGILSQGR